MRIPRSLGFALSASAIVALLVGCSGAGQQNPALPSQTQAQPSSAGQGVLPGASPTITAALRRPPATDLVIGAGQDSASRVGGLYVGQESSLFVNEYALPNTKNAPARCTDPLQGPYGGAVGMTLSAGGVLYVVSPNSKVGRFGYNQYPIDTFGPNCGARGPTLHESFGIPTDVAVDNKSGRVYVTWYPPTGSGGGGIIVYDRGSIYPTRLLANSAIIGSSGVAVDSLGNVFLSGQNTATNIVEFPGGRQNGSTVLSPPGLNYPFGLEFDRNNNLIVSNLGNNTITVYAPPYSAAPTLTIPAKGFTFHCKLDKPNVNLYCSDYTNSSVDVYAYPSGTYEYSITNGLKQANVVFGIAVDPPSN